MFRRLLILLVAWSALATSGRAEMSTFEAGRERTEMFLSGDLSSIWEAMTPEMQDSLGGLDALTTFREDLRNNFGQEAEMIEEVVQSDPQGLQVYLRRSRWTGSDAPMLMQWAFDGRQRIAGLLVQPEPQIAENRFLDYQTQASLILPFRGEWFVVWGGRTLEQNYHAADRAQRFALDVLIRRDGSSHAGDADDVQSYYCWDQPILAPAAATVVSAVEDLPDQEIGTSDPQNPAGNHVVLDLGHGEYAFLAHLRQGSVAVEPGQRVVQGQELGRCGNSGNTSEPHLHIHLQTTPDLATGEGLPAFFETYVADGVPVDRGEPQQGQTVAPL